MKSGWFLSVANHVPADVAVSADAGVAEDVREMPDFRAGADLDVVGGS